MLFDYLILILSLILSAFFSSSESSLLSISKARAKSMKKKAKYIYLLKKEEEKAIIGILLGNNLVNVLASSIATEISLSVFNEIGIALATFVMTFLLLTFGEVIPKSLALYSKEKFLLFTSRILYYWVEFTSPISLTYINLMSYIKKFFNLKGSKDITEEEIEEILILGEKEGEITSYEKKVAVNALDLAETPVGKIVTKSNKIFSVNASKTLSWLENKIEKENIPYSRIPVYFKRKSNIIGYIKVGDILGENGNKRVLSIIRPILIVPYNLSTEQLLHYMSKSGIPIAIVKKEGKMKGIITVTDIIDEIIGEFKEEVDIEKLKLISKTEKKIKNKNSS